LQRPTFITFTGLDAWTDLDRVEALSSRYPIEWGVLFSPDRQGNDPRYPDLIVVRRITDRRLKLAAHLCGGHAKAILAGEDCPSIAGLLAGAFQRFQVNTTDPSADPAVVQSFARDMNIAGQSILQTRSGFPSDPRVDWLYDRSGGRGEAPAAWPVPEPGAAIVGYAGGLGPDTIAQALDTISEQHPVGRPFWIDMETHIRTDGRLDLDKCEAVCRTVFAHS
jgi:hypothetical protein